MFRINCSEDGTHVGSKTIRSVMLKKKMDPETLRPAVFAQTAAAPSPQVLQ